RSALEKAQADVAEAQADVDALEKAYNDALRTQGQQILLDYEAAENERERYELAVIRTENAESAARTTRDRLQSELAALEGEVSGGGIDAARAEGEKLHNDIETL